MQFHLFFITVITAALHLTPIKVIRNHRLPGDFWATLYIEVQDLTSTLETFFYSLSYGKC